MLLLLSSKNQGKDTGFLRKEEAPSYCNGYGIAALIDDEVRSEGNLRRTSGTMKVEGLGDNPNC